MLTRTKLSLRVGILAGIIWGLFLSAYYAMLPNPKFAIICATVCFVALVIFLIMWPRIIKAFKDAAEERRQVVLR
jgi:thiamine transporter ThiT